MMVEARANWVRATSNKQTKMYCFAAKNYLEPSLFPLNDYPSGSAAAAAIPFPNNGSPQNEMNLASD